MANAKKWIGVDGGGTQTRAVIGNENGRLLAFSKGAATNIQSRSLEKIEKTLYYLIFDVLQKSDSKIEQIDTVYLGLAGGDRQTDKKKILQMLSFLERENVNIIIENDTIASLSAGTWGGAGIVLIAGTGSIVYARPPPPFIDKPIRVGGWGYLLGDEGSGFDIGREGLISVLQQYDGRGPKTHLTNKLLNKMNITDPADIVTDIYNQDGIRSRIADIAKIVLEAARQGDWVAMQIVDKAIEQLSLLVTTAKTRKELESNELKLVINGGLFKDTFFKNKFHCEINKRFSDLTLINPPFPPVVGALILALKQSGIIISEDVKSEIEQSWENLS